MVLAIFILHWPISNCTQLRCKCFGNTNVTFVRPIKYSKIKEREQMHWFYFNFLTHLLRQRGKCLQTHPRFTFLWTTCCSRLGGGSICMKRRSQPMHPVHCASNDSVHSVCRWQQEWLSDLYLCSITLLSYQSVFLPQNARLGWYTVNS